MFLSRFYVGYTMFARLYKGLTLFRKWTKLQSDYPTLVRATQMQKNYAAWNMLNYLNKFIINDALQCMGYAFDFSYVGEEYLTCVWCSLHHSK